ncbi:MAG: multicopper oxidase family protein [Armatimonadota bacterium]
MHRAGHFRRLTKLIALTAIIVLAAGASWGQAPGQIMLNPKVIPQFVEPLPHFANHRMTGASFTVSAHEIQQMVLPATFYTALLPPYNAGTYVWGYNVNGIGAHYPGFTVEATRGVPTTMLYSNNLPVSASVVQNYITVDQTLHWADPLMQMGSLLPYTGPPPIVTHLHGGEVPSEFDGGPDQWFTPDGIRGAGYRSLVPVAGNQAVYQYPNDQEPATLWFHDHALGATRLNVYAGLAAYYLLRDSAIERPDLPGGPSDTTVTEPGRAVFADTVYKPEIEFAIQDRMFDTNGELYFPAIGLNPEHPYWLPEFFGNVMLVNGRTWPYFSVEPRRYRFRVLDGCNARFLRMWLQNTVTGAFGPPIWQIGTDGGLLDTPVKLDPSALVPTYLFLAPGERADVIIDFSGFAGQTLTLMNNAKAPFPKGAAADPKTTGVIMQFRVGAVVTGNGGVDPSYNPATLASPRLSPTNRIAPAGAVVKRQLTLNEVMGMGGPLEVLVNNTKWSGKRVIGMNPDGSHIMTPIPGLTPNLQGDYMSELPGVGTTEIWEIINLTADAHPIHLHLTQFQLISRQPFNVTKYGKAYAAAFPGGYDFTMMMNVPAGVFIPAFGPPLAYNTANADGAVGGNPPIGRYLQGVPAAPLLEELGWKDTIKAYPGEVTRVAVRFTQQNGLPYTFDATGTTPVAVDRNGAAAGGPGYVWHCHIVDHEDNEMMRPYLPVP